MTDRLHIEKLAKGYLVIAPATQIGMAAEHKAAVTTLAEVVEVLAAEFGEPVEPDAPPPHVSAPEQADPIAEVRDALKKKLDGEPRAVDGGHQPVAAPAPAADAGAAKPEPVGGDAAAPDRTPTRQKGRATTDDGADTAGPAAASRGNADADPAAPSGAARRDAGRGTRKRSDAATGGAAAKAAPKPAGVDHLTANQEAVLDHLQLAVLKNGAPVAIDWTTLAKILDMSVEAARGAAEKLKAAGLIGFEVKAGTPFFTVEAGDP